MKHHEFSPSRLARFSSCPWSYKNCLNWDGGETDDAKYGNIMHEAIHDDTVLASLPDRDAELIRNLREEHVNRFLKYEHYFELPVAVFKENGEELTFGILDFLYLSPDRKLAGLVDWKFGSQEVESAEKNPQIKAYAAGVFQKFPSVESVFAMVVQPVYGMDDYQKQSPFHRGDLPGILQEIEAVELVAKNATPEDAVPTAANCRYCNKLNCRKYRERMEQNLVLMDSGNSIAMEDQEMTAEFADRLLCAKKEIELIMEERSKLASKILISRGGSENFRVQSGRVSKKTDWAGLCKHLNIPQETVDSFTETTTGEPYLMPRMRIKKKLLK